jgi:hypothetical protein
VNLYYRWECKILKPLPYNRYDAITTNSNTLLISIYGYPTNINTISYKAYDNTFTTLNNISEFNSKFFNSIEEAKEYADKFLIENGYIVIPDHLKILL